MDVFIVQIQQTHSNNQNDMSIMSARSVRQGIWKLLHIQKMAALHAMVITQIITLTDFENRLQFVTVSFDCQIKVLEVEEKEQSFDISISHVIMSNGQIINALPLQGQTGLFAVSTMNEETEECWIQIWRRQSLRGCFGPYETTTLDLKLFQKNFICLPDPREEGKRLSILSIL